MRNNLEEHKPLIIVLSILILLTILLICFYPRDIRYGDTNLINEIDSLKAEIRGLEARLSEAEEYIHFLEDDYTALWTTVNNYHREVEKND